MAQLIRTFSCPSHLSADAIQRLAAALQEVPQRQQELALRAVGVAVAVEIRHTDDTFELCYDLDDPRTLGSLVLGDRPDRDLLLTWARELCSTLSAAYPIGQPPVLRHGGLCGASVVLPANGGPRVLDFGVADCYAAVLEGADEFWLKQVASNVAPEVWNAPALFGQQSDIFALGVLLYELATGKHPFGAIRDDAEDCKYQILIELPVPPDQRNPSIDSGFSDCIFQALRSEPAKRFATFDDLGSALQDCARQPRGDAGPADAAQVPGPLVPQIEDPVLPEGLAEVAEHEQRRQYLAEQARLREERQQAEQRQAERRERTRLLQARLRRHALAVGTVLVLVVLGVSAWVVQRTRARNREQVVASFANIEARLGARFDAAAADALIDWLGITAPSRGLQRAVAHLAKATPELALSAPACEDLSCVSGTATLTVAGQSLALPFVLDGAESSLRFDGLEAGLTIFVTEVRDTLASAELSASVAGLIETIRTVFRDAPHADAAESEVSRLLAGVADGTACLGYLGYQGTHRRIELGSFEQVLGVDAVEFEVTVVSLHDATEYAGVRLQFWYDTAESTTGQSRLLRVVPVPKQEPPEHRRRCVAVGVAELQHAFDDRDADRLIALGGAGRSETVNQMLAWVRACQTADLLISDPDANGVAEARIRYRPGLLAGSDGVFQTDPLTIAFSADHDWGIPPDWRIDWPGPPLPFLRQQQGKALLERFVDAWRRQDAAAYLAIFGSSRRTPEAVSAMFKEMEAGPDQFTITAREHPDADAALYIDVRGPQAAGAGRSFRFVLGDHGLRWSPESRADDPLWLAGGMAHQLIVDRLTTATAADMVATRSAFESARQDMTAEEQGELVGWIAALESVYEHFEVVDSATVAGFPRGVQLKGTAHFPMIFRLVRMTESAPYLLYVLEREVCIPDVYRAPSDTADEGSPSYWTEPDHPWERWAKLIGPAPRQQLVGLSASEAAAYARTVGCDLLTCPEWLHLSRSPEATVLGFPGDVWEFCRDPQAADPVVAVGGSWLDRDVAVQASGHQAPDTVRVARHGTIGFRIARRIHLPAAVLSDLESATDAP